MLHLTAQSKLTPSRNMKAFFIGLSLYGLIAAGCAPLGTRTFRPATEGKKLLHYRGPGYDYMMSQTDQMEEIAFDGLILGGAMPFFFQWKEHGKDTPFENRIIDEKQLMDFAAKMKEVPFKRYTDNFYLCYSATGERDTHDFDLFHDMSWVVENWRIMARVAKAGGFKGICFDTEFYAGVPLFGYALAKYKDTKSLEEYEDRAFEMGAEIQRAINESFPDITIIMLFGFSAGHYGVPQHPANAKLKYQLLPAFCDGMMSEMKEGATLHDQFEASFSNRIPGSYARQRAFMTDIAPERSRDRAEYREHHRAGFSFWADCWGDFGKGRPLYLDDFQKNYYTPEEFAYSLHHAMAYSDKYVWMWPGDFKWWQRKAKTVDAEGNEVMADCPSQYIHALEQAHFPVLPEPPRSRPQNTYRNMPASTQQGYSDEQTFGDLRETKQLICDLPGEWRFRFDADEAGLARGYHTRDYDDGLWPTIMIREFWENQIYSPYDGCAWYRLTWDMPDVPEGRKVYIAFGGIADEAKVYVNGKLLYESRFGDNIRHERFLVDVTDQIKADEPLTISVRVWNTGWCGGIWKNVKLVAAKN